MRDALLAVRSIDTDPDSPGFNGPAVPSGWRSVYQSGGWYAVRSPSRVQLAVHRVNTNTAGTRGLFLVCGPRPVLDSLDASSDLLAPIVDAWTAALAGPGLARDVMRRWRWYRIDGFVRDPETGDPVAVMSRDLELLPEGSTLPDPAANPLPWDLARDGSLTTQAQAVVRVTAIHRPAFMHTVAGWADHVSAAETTA